MDKLAQFLYMLMRDEIPTGVPAKIVLDLVNTNVEYSNPELRDMAYRYAGVILND